MKINVLLFFVLIFLNSCINNKEPKRSTKSIKIDSLKKNTNSSTVLTSHKKMREVFGFHPHWLKKSYKNYDFKLLTSISYFAYEIDPYTGKYKTIRDWETTILIDSAKENTSKVYLTVTNFSKRNNNLFLTNELAQKTSIHSILQLLIARKAHGVTINFEDVPCKLKSNYTNYIKNLSMRLKEFNKTVVITLPTSNNNNCFDIMSLKEFVEYFVVMAKDYYRSSSDIAGPVAPLYSDEKWTHGSIKHTVESYLGQGIPKEKFIIMIAYYGSKWQTEDDQVPSKSIQFIGNLTYKTIKNQYPQRANFDPESQTNYLNIKEDNKFIQIWFDDSESLGRKYNFINKMDLAGVGIWALGFDDGYPDLWEVLHEKFKN